MITGILDRYNNSYCENGSVIGPEIIATFIKSLTNILMEKYNDYLSKTKDYKDACIGVLEFAHFPVTTNK